jgi:HEPN domain-containing protein
MDDEKTLAIRRWLIKARNDLKTAQATLDQMPDVTDTVCFHAQQCMEKALKAYLTWADIHAERTHFLPRLLEQCIAREPEMSCLTEHARKLTDYAVEVRYIDDWREISREEAQEAVALAQTALEFILKKLPEGGIQE